MLRQNVYAANESTHCPCHVRRVHFMKFTKCRVSFSVEACQGWVMTQLKATWRRPTCLERTYKAGRARAGGFALEKSVIKNMWICAKHRHAHMESTGVRKHRQYPLNQSRPGRGQGVNSRYALSLQMARAFYRMYRVLVQVGQVRIYLYH